ncbi:hypothetical protein J6590_050885 [Homalodisca vitripennis]|nr:hypothetical protein J6590_050885 [Homalodisca vitripennis]
MHPINNPDESLRIYCEGETGLKGKVESEDARECRDLSVKELKTYCIDSICLSALTLPNLISSESKPVCSITEISTAGENAGEELVVVGLIRLYGFSPIKKKAHVRPYSVLRNKQRKEATLGHASDVTEVPDHTCGEECQRQGHQVITGAAGGRLGQSSVRQLSASYSIREVRSSEIHSDGYFLNI